MDAAKNLPIWEGRARASDLLIGAASPLFRLSQPVPPSFPAAFPLFPTLSPPLPTAFPPHLPGFLPFLTTSPPLPTAFSASPNHFFRLTCPAFCLSQPLIRLSQPLIRLSQPLLRSSQPLFPPHLPGFSPRLIRFWCRTNANFPLRGPKNHLLWGISELQYPCFCPFMGEKQLLSDFSARFSVSRFLVFKSL